MAAATTYHYAVLALSQNGDGAQSDSISATTSAAPPLPPAVVFEGVMVVESGFLGDGEVLGYAHRGGLGNFEITSAEQPSMVGGHIPVLGLLRMPGVHTMSEFGTFVDAVALVYPDSDAPTPFVLTVGGREFAAAAAAVGASDMMGETLHAWFWDRRCASWQSGDTVAVSFERVASDDPRLAAATDDATLGSLSVAGAQLAEPFDAAVLDHTADAAAETTQVTVAAEASDNNACDVEISPADADPAAAGHQVDLADDGAVVTVTLTAADGATTGTYTLTVGRGGTRPAAAVRLNLQGAPDLGFDPGQHRYQIHTPQGATSTRVDTLGAGGATVEVFSYQAGSRQVRNTPANGTVPLSSGGDTLIATRVSTPRNERQSIYTVKLSPRPGQGSGAATRSNGTSDPRLASLSVSPGTLTPTFAAATFDYTVSVGSDVEHLTVAATAVTGASVVITEPDADPGTEGHQVALNAGEVGGNAAQTAFLVVVTAGTKIESYTVTAVRAAPLSEDATLGSLSLSAGTLDPVFSAGRAGYTAEVAATDARITVTAAPTHASATAAVTPADADTNTAGHQVDLSAGINFITITVTAEDGTTVNAYTVSIFRPSNDATLRTLSISAGTLSPAFGADVVEYIVSVDHDITVFTVDGIANHPEARVSVAPADADADTGGHQTELSVGDNVITITVTAEDGTTSEAYMVTAVRSPAGGRVAAVRLAALGGDLIIGWDSPTLPADEAPTDYQVAWAEADGDYGTDDSVNAYPTPTTYTVSGLSAGEYRIKVRARYRSGRFADRPWSGPWTESFAIPVEPTFAEQQEGLAFAELREVTVTYDAGGGHIRINWGVPPNPGYGNTSSAYRVAWTDSEGNFSPWPHYRTPYSGYDRNYNRWVRRHQVPWTLWNVPTGTYQVRVSPQYGTRSGPWTYSQIVTVTREVVPPKPAKTIEAVRLNVFGNTMVIDWDQPPIPRFPPKQYEVTWVTSTGEYASGTSATVRSHPGGTSHIVTGLTAGGSYKARVRPEYRRNEKGPWTESTSPAAIPDPVTAAQPEDTGTVTLSYSDPWSGVTVIAGLQDPSGIGAPTWQWERRQGTTGAWGAAQGKVIHGAHGTTSYVPTSSDVGYHIRATATYFSGAKIRAATAAATSAVISKPDCDSYQDLTSDTLGGQYKINDVWSDGRELWVLAFGGPVLRFNICSGASIGSFHNPKPSANSFWVEGPTVWMGHKNSKLEAYTIHPARGWIYDVSRSYLDYYWGVNGIWGNESILWALPPAEFCPATVTTYHRASAPYGYTEIEPTGPWCHNPQGCRRDRMGEHTRYWAAYLMDRTYVTQNPTETDPYLHASAIGSGWYAYLSGAGQRQQVEGTADPPIR